MPRCAVIGDPVGHSLSPVIHTAGYAALGLSAWSYEAIRVEAGGVGAFLRSLAPPGEEWRGISVTAPHKREALSLASTVTERAELAGGVNTLVPGGTGWVGDNTDLPGAVAALRERYDGELAVGLILGAGATAASTGLALAELGVRRIRVAARDAARAADTIASISAHPSRPAVEVVDLATVESGAAGVVVSTVPVIAQTEDLVARVTGADVLFEVTYTTWPTPLAAAATGIVVSGLDLLVHQAVLQFQQFTGRTAPLDVMRAAGEAALAAR